MFGRRRQQAADTALLTTVMPARLQATMSACPYGSNDFWACILGVAVCTSLRGTRRTSLLASFLSGNKSLPVCIMWAWKWYYVAQTVNSTVWRVLNVRAIASRPLRCRCAGMPVPRTHKSGREPGARIIQAGGLPATLSAPSGTQQMADIRSDMYLMTLVPTA